MDINTLFGLPAHPLLVHIPVVLIPLALAGTLGLFWEPWRRRFGWATAAILVVAGICTQLAISSGQTLRRTLDNDTALVKAHVAIAENIRPWLLLFFLALVAFLWLERRQRETGTVDMRQPLLAGTLVASIVFGVVSVYWVQRIGHTGAKAVWEPKMKEAQRQESRSTGVDTNGDGDSR
jgi:uncharacterized membrane protein